MDTHSIEVLDGVRVVEWTEAMAGPYAAMLLGDLGFELVAQIAHEDAQILRVFGMRRPPDFGQDMPVGQHFACIGDEGAQQIVFLG